MSATSVQGKLGVLGVLLALGLPACVSIGTLDVPAPDARTSQQLPFSVRVEIGDLYPGAPTWRWKKEDLKKSLVTYLQKRKTFREAVDGPSDLVLRVDAELRRHPTFPETDEFLVKGQLILSRTPPSGSGLAGSYAVKATREASLSEVFTKGGISGAFADLMSELLKETFDKLCDRIEQDRESIVAALGKGSGPVVASRPTGPASAPHSEVDTVPPAQGSMRPHAYAIVMGVEHYQQPLTKAEFAAHDAEVMGQYLTRMLGYAEENVVVLLNDRATKNSIEKYIEGWLPNHVEKDGSVFIYFSGHGAPNPKTGQAYLVPYDGDPAYLDVTGYPLKRLYAALEKLPVKDVTVVLDACFSGAGGRSVLAQGAKPMVLSVENAIVAGGKTVVLAASAGDQISSAWSERGHGLLTYFFLKGLQGEGDLNQDGRIELGELFGYLKPQVARTARREFNNDQTPQLVGNPAILAQGIRLVDRTGP